MPQKDVLNAYNQALGLLPSEEDLYRQYYGLGQAGQQQLHNYYGTIEQKVADQFNPAFRMAQARLAANPLLGDSGYQNRLNRQLQQGAFGDLSSMYGEQANQLSGGNLAALRNMLAGRQQARQGLVSDYFQARLRPKQKKKGVADYAAQLAGAGLGFAVGGPPGAAAGAQIGGSFGSDPENLFNYGTGGYGR